MDVKEIERLDTAAAKPGAAKDSDGVAELEANDARVAAEPQAELEEVALDKEEVAEEKEAAAEAAWEKKEELEIDLEASEDAGDAKAQARAGPRCLGFRFRAGDRPGGQRGRRRRQGPGAIGARMSRV